MRRILIFREISNASYNIHMSEKEFSDNVIKELDFNCPNMGNKIWFWGLMSEIDTSYIQLSYYKKEYTIDYINNNFDGVILPDANLFGLTFERYIDSNTSAIEKLKIPIYIISVGVQIDNYKDIDSLVNRIGPKVKRMINAVYNTGGAVCVRGYITQEFCDKCGAHEVFAGGCPSLYQFGPNLRINKKEYSKDNFKVAVNGHIDNLYGKYYSQIFDNYRGSEYICQDEFFSYLYKHKEGKNDGRFNSNIHLIKDVGLTGAELLNLGKVNLFCSPYEWIKYLADNEFSMSFGSRIHGNIAALLAGVPALLHVRDLRTLEIANFYGIPIIYDEELCNQDLYKIYEKLDYTKFNKRYNEIYNQFQDFLKSCDLVEKMNDNNSLKYLSSCKKDNIIISDYKYRGKLAYELANSAFYIYRKYCKKMNLI